MQIIAVALDDGAHVVAAEQLDAELALVAVGHGKQKSIEVRLVVIGKDFFCGLAIGLHLPLHHVVGDLALALAKPDQALAGRVGGEHKDRVREGKHELVDREQDVRLEAKDVPKAVLVLAMLDFMLEHALSQAEHDLVVALAKIEVEAVHARGLQRRVERRPVLPLGHLGVLLVRDGDALDGIKTFIQEAEHAPKDVDVVVGKEAAHPSAATRRPLDHVEHFLECSLHLLRELGRLDGLVLGKNREKNHHVDKDVGVRKVELELRAKGQVFLSELVTA